MRVGEEWGCPWECSPPQAVGMEGLRRNRRLSEGEKRPPTAALRSTQSGPGPC